MIVRPYNKGDEKQIFKLWQKVFGNLLNENDIFYINEKWWDWRVLGNPLEMPKIFVGSKESGGIGVHQMVECFPFNGGGGNNKIYSSTLTMAEEDYRGIGLLKIINNCNKEIKKQDSIAYGLPNERSLPIFKKFEWVYTGDIPILVRPLNSLFKIFDVHIKTKKYEVKKIKKFDKIINDFKIDDFKYMVKRTDDLLNWKYYKNPLKKYEKIIALDKGKIKGYCVFRCAKISKRPIGVILEIFAHNKEIFNVLLNEVIAYFTKQKMNAVSCFMIKNNFYYNSLLKRGFLRVPKKLMSKRNAFLIFNSNDQNILNIKNWYISYGDWDCI